MKALYCDGSKVSFRQDMPIPQPRAGELLLKVKYCGICDTDIQLAKGYMGFEGILGHEFVGVDQSGQRWVAEINNACHACPWCERGLTSHCPNRSVLGIFRHDGAMAEYVAVPEKNLHRVPDSISDLSAVFVEPLAAAFQIPEQLHISSSDRVAVLGDGKLGILCAWVLATQSQEVTLIGKHPEKLKLAGGHIQTCLLENAVENGRKGYDLVVDATGNATGLSTACELCRPRGTVVLKTTIQGNHSLSLAAIVIDELTLVGSRCGPFAKAIEALDKRQFPVETLIEAVYPLDEAESAFQIASQKGVAKMILRMS
ncbi:MAG: hypothetical protein RJA81_188 [Planctomycetota bacterium]|jgi:threonine dehydrogenase-like Zn-dependent dehydrogenase